MFCIKWLFCRMRVWGEGGGGTHTRNISPTTHTHTHITRLPHDFSIVTEPSISHSEPRRGPCHDRPEPLATESGLAWPRQLGVSHSP